jgi:hypothetical protein
MVPPGNSLGALPAVLRGWTIRRSVTHRENLSIPRSPDNRVAGQSLARVAIFRYPNSRYPKFDPVTTLPTWAVWVLSFGSPILTAAVALVGQRIGRRGTQELESRSKREEVMRSLRWSAELAVSDDVRKARLGNRELRALQNSKLLSPAEEDFIYAALDAALDVPVHAIEQAGGDVEVVATTDVSATGEVLLPSEDEGRPREANG